MPLKYEDLDPVTRGYALAELDHDIATGSVTPSDWLRPTAIVEYEALLHDALRYYDDLWLEERLAPMLADFERRRTPSGGQTTARLPAGAARLLAEGDFNRYYMRGVCARAIAEGQTQVEIYRARLSLEPRPDSLRRVDTRVSAEGLLTELRERTWPPDEATVGKPNSGLSVRLM